MKQQLDLLTITEDYVPISIVAIWQPSPLLRWKRVSIDLMSYNKVLQQMWYSNTGIQEWRDIPEED